MATNRYFNGLTDGLDMKGINTFCSGCRFSLDNKEVIIMLNDNDLEDYDSLKGLKEITKKEASIIAASDKYQDNNSMKTE